MRYAILSDIHGNLEAFRAVLDALSDEMIDSYLSVGDVVGYGADPKECISLLRSLNPEVLIAGNHEWGVLGLKELDYFNELAQKAISWTKAILDKDEIDYLKSFSLVHNDERMSLVHGTLNNPDEFYYIFGPDDTDATMDMMSGSVCFVGHSHVPGIFASNHTKIESLDSRKIRVDYERKYIINVGSIGQPRDGNPKASYAIYDNEEALLEIKRVEYDVKRAQAKILKAGLPARLADRLSEGR